MLDAWTEVADPPALFLHVPGHGDVGERELMADLADAVYRRNISRGIHKEDSRCRHFVTRNFPYGANPGDVAFFMNELGNACSVTNEFFGVDCIDLTSWVGKNPSKGGWETLVHHVQAHPDADFVFFAQCTEPQASKLADQIRLTCGIPLEIVKLLPPEQNMLVAETIGSRGDEPVVALLSSWFSNLSESDLEISYALPRALAARAWMLGVDLHKPGEMKSFLADYGDSVTKLYTTRKLGF